jgi:hypothetical protein
MMSVSAAGAGELCRALPRSGALLAYSDLAIRGRAPGCAGVDATEVLVSGVWWWCA